MAVLVGREAPDFTVPAVLSTGEIVDQFNLKEAINGKYGLLFFYPLNFTFVCPSELIALDHAIEAFKERKENKASKKCFKGHELDAVAQLVEQEMVEAIDGASIEGVFVLKDPTNGIWLKKIFYIHSN